jgi:hypothetical protein
VLWLKSPTARVRLTPSPTNAFRKKIENHIAAVPLGCFACNFIRILRILRVTPAMAAGVTNRLSEGSDLVALLEAEETETQRAA